MRCCEPARFATTAPTACRWRAGERVARLAAAVTANQSVLDAAVAWEADLLLVHHGYFWRGEAEPVVGMKRRRLATLLAADMSLLAYHLPLDAHPELGNNARFGALLGSSIRRRHAQDEGDLGAWAPGPTVASSATYARSWRATPDASRC
jgi:putative NIF3 family GTP cyclohydrolase 1 type 2